MARRKKLSLVSIPRKKPRTRHSTKKVKSAFAELNLLHNNIVSKAFDGEANMNGVHKGLNNKNGRVPRTFGIHVH